MKSLLNNIVGNFGFDGVADFYTSMVHQKLLLFTLPSAFVCFTIFEELLGVTSAIFIAFVLMATLELVTGLWSARAQNKAWSSKKFSRFGLKILVWLCLIGIANSFVISYENLAGVQNWMIYQLFHWLHGTLVVYISFEYLISIIENFGRITGETNNKLIAFLQKKLDQFIGIADEMSTPKAPENPEEENREN